MGEKFKHLTYVQRSNIESLLKEGHTQAEIARNLGVSRTTIFYELKRGEYYKRDSATWKDIKAYSAGIAEEKYRRNLKEKGKEYKIGADWEYLRFIEKMIVDLKYSPEAVLNHIKKEGLKFETEICLSTLYNYIRNGVFLNISLADLPQPKKKKKKKKVKRTQKRKSAGTSIEERAEYIESRLEFGHWEMDTVIGKKKGKKLLLVLTERKTRKEIIEPLKSTKASEVVRVLDKLERKFGDNRFRKVFKSITVDNGVEFSDFQGMQESRRNKKNRTEFYYCHAYSSWERGSNENQNRMIRRWLPKGTSFNNKTRAEIKRIEKWINNYPRPMFGGLSSEELYEIEMLKLSG